MAAEDLGRGIYIITTEDGFPCKVGVTNDLDQRVQQLQIGNWHKLRASWFSFVVGHDWRIRKLNFWAAFSNAAVDLEVITHRKLKELDLHLSGEWFGIGEDDCIKVINKVAEESGLRLVGIEVLTGLEHYVALPARQVRYLQAIVDAEASAQAAISRRPVDFEC